MSTETAFAVNPKFVTLRYLSGVHKYEPDAFIKAAWTPDWYVTVYEVPLLEMLSTTLQDLAAELLLITNEADWVASGKRPMARGDMFYAGESAWVFIKPEHVKQFSDAHLHTLKVSGHADCFIARLE